MDRAERVSRTKQPSYIDVLKHLVCFTIITIIIIIIIPIFNIIIIICYLYRFAYCFIYVNIYTCVRIYFM